MTRRTRAHLRRFCVITLLSAAACTGNIVGPSGDPSSDGGLVPTVPDAALPPDAPPAELPLASGIRVTDIVLIQSVEIPLVENGTEVSQSNASIVEGKAGLVDVRYSLDAGWQPREIVARLYVDPGSGEPMESELLQHVTTSSGTAPRNATFAFELSGVEVTVGARYAVSLHEVSASSSGGGATDGARFPSDGTAPLGVRSANGPLHLTLVPFRYDADGSGRLPPLDDAAIQSYRDRFAAMYPVADVVLTVREPVSQSSTIGASSGWGNWLDRLTAIREQDNAPANTFYYGIAAPASNFNSYCSFGCILGLGWVPGRDNDYLHAAVGVSFDDGVNVYTSLHEVGHTMGRSHAPCGGPSGVDWSYPYGGASVGVWGYDARDASLKDPDEYTDIMGYCNDQWISDYTYEGIFERVSYVNQGAAYALDQPLRFRVALVDADGSARWRRYASLRRPLSGGEVSVELFEADGRARGEATAHFFPYDHLPGGMLMVPVPDGTPPAAIESAQFGRLAW